MNSYLPNLTLLAQSDPLDAVVAAPLFTFNIGHWTIVVSNHMFMVSLTALLLMVLIPLGLRRNGLVPRGLRNLIESVCVYLRQEVARPILGEHTDRFTGYVWTLFFFILSLNLISLVPLEKIINLLTGTNKHFGGPATANIWITGALAFAAFLTTHVSGIRQHGLLRYLATLAPPVPWWIVWLVYPLELVTIFVRPFTLAVRLFANMVAGHIVITAILGLILIFKSYTVAAVSIAGSVALSFLEILVAFVQAYIFTLLATLYISFAVEPEH